MVQRRKSKQTIMKYVVRGELYTRSTVVGTQYYAKESGMASCMEEVKLGLKYNRREGRERQAKVRS